MEKPKTSLSVEEYLVKSIQTIIFICHSGKTRIIHSSTAWKFEEFSHTIILKKFRQTNFHTKDQLVIQLNQISYAEF